MQGAANTRETPSVAAACVVAAFLALLMDAFSSIVLFLQDKMLGIPTAATACCLRGGLAVASAVVPTLICCRLSVEPL